jgi:hypothetical protein
MRHLRVYVVLRPPQLREEGLSAGFEDSTIRHGLRLAGFEVDVP